jgi:uncharacterized SAM-binding protein YcdF (DUF218 family)
VTSAVGPVPREADAIVVLGCRSASRQRRRVARAVALYRDGRAPLLVLSGGGAGQVSEAELMRREAVAKGMPAAALLLEPGSRDTIENARETAALLHARGLREIVLVSDYAHLPRAALLFGLAGLSVIGRAGVRAPNWAAEIAALLREATALPRSLLRALSIARESRRRPQGCGR